MNRYLETLVVWCKCVRVWDELQQNAIINRKQVHSICSGGAMWWTRIFVGEVVVIDYAKFSIYLGNQRQRYGNDESIGRKHMSVDLVRSKLTEILASIRICIMQMFGV